MSPLSKSLFHKRCITSLCGLLAAFSLVGFANVPASAQDNEAPAAVKRFLNDQTAAVGWIDISNVDLDALVAFAEKLDIPTEDTTETKAIQTALVQLGVKRIYWVSDLGNLMSPAQALIVPCKKENSGAVLLILKTLAKQGNATAVADGDAILFGNESAVEQLQQERTGQPDPLLLNAVSNITQPHGLAIRTPVVALIPVVSVLPEVFKDSTQVAEAAELLVKVRSVVVTSQLPPPNGEIRISTESADVAIGLAKLLNTVTAKKIGDAATGVKVIAQDSDVLLSINSIEATNAAAKGFYLLTASARAQARRVSTLNSLKQIGLAMHNFYDVYEAFPAQALADKEGRKLLSWRVLILPYLGEPQLYEQFHLDEPWDSDHNKTLIPQMPFVYGGHPGRKQTVDWKTRMVVPLTDGSVFGTKGNGTRISNILDGTSNTLMVVEVSPEKAVIWTKPEDITIDKTAPLASIINETAEEGFHCCICDGSARFFSRSIKAEILNALISFAGGEMIDFDKL